MRIMVTGATGFVGRHLVERLIAENYLVSAISREESKAVCMPWFDSVKYFSKNIYQGNIFDEIDLPDILVHLAWSGLPNFQSLEHVTNNLPREINFLESAVKSGVKRLIIAGTCLEYGMQCGALNEEDPTNPITPYGFAKDSIRKFLQLMQVEHKFGLQWARLFYMYGDGQNQNSLLAQLDSAIKSGQKSFNMSAGDQLRDYLYIGDIIGKLVYLIKHPEIDGVINCSSGVPISVYDLVVKKCKEMGSSIMLNRGYYPYPLYEPMAFWGVSGKIKNY